jgi:hypothetical protein
MFEQAVQQCHRNVAHIQSTRWDECRHSYNIYHHVSDEFLTGGILFIKRHDLQEVLDIAFYQMQREQERRICYARTK